MYLLSNCTVSVPRGFHDQDQVNDCPDENSTYGKELAKPQTNISDIEPVCTQITQK